MKTKPLTRAAGLVLLLASVALPAGATDAPTPKPADTTAPSSADVEAAPAAAMAPPADDEAPVPGVVPVETLWTAYEAEADFDALHAQIELANRFEADPDDAAVAARCVSDATELDRLLRRYPISLRLWSLELTCAGHANDAAREDRAHGALQALVEHDLERGRWPGPQFGPIRALTEQDIWTWIELSGLEVLTAFYPVPNAAGILTLRAELWSAEDQRETIWYFDFLSGMARSASGPDAAAYAVARVASIQALRGEPGEGGNSLLDDHNRAIDAHRRNDVDALVAMAENNVAAQRLLADRCLLFRLSDCAEAAVDALLPLAESGSAVHLLYLAYAHQFGLGVESDADAAATLFERARKRLGEAAANQLFQKMLASSNREPPLYLRESIQAQADAGDIDAYIDSLTLQPLRKELPARDAARLQDIAEQGHSQANLLLAMTTGERDPEGSRAALQRSVDAGNLAAARVLIAQRNRDGVPDLAAQMALYESVLSREIQPSMLAEYIQLLKNRGKHQRALEWVQVRAMLGFPDALLELSEAIIDGAPGFEADLPQAQTILKGVIAESTDDTLAAHARQLLGELLLAGGNGVEADLPAAVALFRENRTHPESILHLAVLLVRHPELAQPGEDGPALLRARAESNDTEAQYELALLLLDNRIPGAPRNESLAWLERAQSGSVDALNLLGWTLCTHHDPQLRDPPRALPFAKELRKVADGRPAFLDTVAACYAANGQFDRAVKLQQTALDALAPNASEKARQELGSRLRAYQEQRPHLEPE